MQGQTYQIGTSDDDDTSDVTGTWVASDKPIAVFAGASSCLCARYRALAREIHWCRSNCRLTLGAIRRWRSLLPGGRMGTSYRVLAAYSNTVVTITGARGHGIVTRACTLLRRITTTNEVVVVTNQAGQFYDIIVDGPVEFQASRPIQVAQFANGRAFDHVCDSIEGDPCEILLPPTGHYLQTNIVFTLPNEAKPEILTRTT